jgi:hypothetical protein
MNSKLLKGILLIIGVFYTAYMNPPVILATTIITAICIGGTYFVKNFYAPSTSSTGTLNLQDVVSTLLLAIFVALENSIASYIVSGAIVISLLVKTVLSVVITYITTTFFAGQTKVVNNQEVK